MPCYIFVCSRHKDKNSPHNNHIEFFSFHFFFVSGIWYILLTRRDIASACYIYISVLNWWTTFGYINSPEIKPSKNQTKIAIANKVGWDHSVNRSRKRTYACVKSINKILKNKKKIFYSENDHFSRGHYSKKDKDNNWPVNYKAVNDYHSMEQMNFRANNLFIEFCSLFIYWV